MNETNGIEHETLRPTYRAASGYWEGVVVDAQRQVVAACGHTHRNRDSGSYTNGRSASECARALCREMGGER